VPEAVFFSENDYYFIRADGAHNMFPQPLCSRDHKNQEPEGTIMNIFNKQTPARSIEPEENILISVALGIASIYVLWVITGMLIAILS
jgi:hypothetical protein